MMTSSEIRQQFFDFFKSKSHAIVPSAPIVVKDDPTLMFTNAGMNQFKDYFLGNKKPEHTRVADTQKCLRVSGKHNDLEEVGVDTYHHTMFEMLGNWSFGDYFKEEAIAWSWELLTDVYKIEKDRLYVTVFEGDEKENLPKDNEAMQFWRRWIDEDRIIMGNKKDNFWEMGDTGPCGPCTEIHVDSRPNDERKNLDGKTLVNNDHPQVIEIWNNVFIQYNRKKDGSLEPLPAKHVDTGMGFERLVRVLQQKSSNYDTDVFTGTIAEVEKLSNKRYTNTDSKQDIAFRVIADHIRAISFPIADALLPSRDGAGYVIRRILRRAVRYYFSYLDVKQPLLYKLIPLLAEQFKNVFPELDKQKDFISNIIIEEEYAFLRTIDKGLKLIDDLPKQYWASQANIIFGDQYDPENLERANWIHAQKNIFLEEKLKTKSPIAISGSIAFELYDTFGFPIDLTELMAREMGWTVDIKSFNEEMQKQKERSRAAATGYSGTSGFAGTSGYAGYSGYTGHSNIQGATGPSSNSNFQTYSAKPVNSFESDIKIIDQREAIKKGNKIFLAVFDKTPFYPEGGGQVGDIGIIKNDTEIIKVLNTYKENDLVIHELESLAKRSDSTFHASIDANRRKKIQVHHSATHLMHAALRTVLGKHVVQKGSLVNDEQLRFDFSHFAKVTDGQLSKIEALVNEKIRENIPVEIKHMPKDEAVATGAMALFGEKYGDIVRVVIIDPTYSVELCGGTHVINTGELGIFKIKHETAVGAGVRRIEAVSGKAAEDHIKAQFKAIQGLRETLKNPKDINKAVENLVAENAGLKKQLEKVDAKNIEFTKKELLKRVETLNGINFLGEIIETGNPDVLKKICFALKSELKNYVIVLAADIDRRPHVALIIDENVSVSKNLDAGKINKELIAPLIKGGGGGQKTLATAGGQDASKLNEVIAKVKSLL